MSALFLVTYYDLATGRLRGTGYAPTGDLVANLPAGCAMALGGHDLEASWWDGATVAARPVLAPPILAGDVLDLSGLPAGTTLTVTNEDDEVAAVEAGEPAVTFADAGTYRLRLVPPFPWIALDMEVTLP